MKKLIMLSAFALGTITAGASNDLFKNYYNEKTQEDPIFLIKQKKRHVVKEFGMDANGGLIQTTLVDNTFCDEDKYHGYYGFIIHETYIINNTSGYTRTYNVYDLGICF